MERVRQRGHSFYADDDEDIENVTSEGVSSLSVSLDDIEYENGDEEIEEPRGRSRSLSEDDGPFLDTDEGDNAMEEISVRSRTRSRTHLGANEKGIIPVIPGAQTDAKPRSNSTERKGKTGPLTQKEVEVLRKGLEEATTTRNIEQLLEEEEEILAAKEEQEERLGRRDSSDEEASATGDKKTEISRSVGAGVLESVIGTRKSVVPAPVTTVPSRRATGAAAIQQKYTAGNENKNMRRFKILLLGDSGVGKSSLIFRWNEDKFSSTLVGTVGVNFKTKKVSVEGEAVSVQVWDTAGQEQFHQITTTYYKGAHAIMVVYDISDKKSLENVEYWIRNIKQHANAAVHVCLVGNKTDLRAVAMAQESGNDDKYGIDGDNANDSHEQEDARVSDADEDEDDMALLDDDSDASSEGVTRTVSRLDRGRLQCIDFATGEATAERLGVPYFETSAKDSSGTTEAFMSMARIILGYERMTEDNDCEGVVPAQKRRTIMATLGFDRWGASRDKDKVKDTDGKTDHKEKEKEKNTFMKKKGKTKEGTMLGRIIGSSGKRPSKSSSASSGALASSPGDSACGTSVEDKESNRLPEGNNGSSIVDGAGAGTIEKEKKRWFGFG